MIIETAKETIIGSGGKSTAFTIQGNSKVYKILSNDLYTNKELACVRELITNCIDGQILNGCTDKFIVQAPGRLDPRFVVRDFGPGMSDFTIRGNDEEPGIYNSYFASTKTSSNDFIGGFGLGSKAPLAYTDTFNLTSYHNGEVRGYVIYQDDTGPQIKPTFVDKMGPDDRTGVEVVVPVNPEDFEKFASEIAYVMRPLGDIAEVRGVKDIKYFPEFDDVYLAKEAPWGERGNIMAVYGGIVYPIGSVIKEQTWMMTRCTTAYIKFPMGELDVAPSREALSFDKRTVANIHKRVAEIDAKLFAEDSKKWIDCKYPRHVFREIDSLGYTARKYMEKAGSNIESLKYSKEQLTYSELYKRFKMGPEWCNLGVVYDIVESPRLRRIRESGSSSTTISINSLIGINIKNVEIVIDDVKGRVPLMRALNSIEMSKDEVKLTGKVPRGFGKSVLFVDPTDEDAMKLLERLKVIFDGDNINMYKTSELLQIVKPWIEVRKRTNEPRPKSPSAHRFFKNENDVWVSEDLFIPASEADEIQGYAIVRNRSNAECLDADKGWLNYDSNFLTRIADLSGIKEFTVVRPQIAKKVRKLGEVECLFEKSINDYIMLIDKVDYDEYVSPSRRAQPYLNHITRNEELNFLSKYFSSKNKEISKDFAKLSTVNNRWGWNRFAGADNRDLNRKLELCAKIFDKLKDNAYDNDDKMVIEFETNYHIVSEYMGRRGTLSKEQVAQIVKFMKAVESAK